MKCADYNNNEAENTAAPVRENALNRLCHSLLSPENSKRFQAFPEAWCHSFGLTRDETHAVTDLDVLRLLELGGDIRRLSILTEVFGMDLLELGAQQNAMSKDEFIVLLNTRAWLHPS